MPPEQLADPLPPAPGQRAGPLEPEQFHRRAGLGEPGVRFAFAGGMHHARYDQGGGEPGVAGGHTLRPQGVPEPEGVERGQGQPCAADRAGAAVRQAVEMDGGEIGAGRFGLGETAGAPNWRISRSRNQSWNGQICPAGLSRLPSDQRLPRTAVHGRFCLPRDLPALDAQPPRDPPASARQTPRDPPAPDVQPLRDPPASDVQPPRDPPAPDVQPPRDLPGPAFRNDPTGRLAHADESGACSWPNRLPPQEPPTEYL